MKCWEAGHAEKHTICWKACFVVTLSCLFFLMEMEMLRSRSCWEAQNLLKSMFCCEMFIFFTEMVKLKCWEAGHAEKHTICWKACFVVTLSCLFFLWKWWNLNAEKQVMLRSTKSAEKHVLLWHDDSFLMEMAKLTWNAEKQIMLRSKNFLLKSMFCCDMSNFFDGKKLELLMFDWGTFKKHPNWN